MILDRLRKSSGGGRRRPRPSGPQFPIDYKPSIHERKITRFFDDIGGSGGNDADAPLTPIPSIFICFTNRSGSNHLAEVLASTGKLPLAPEAFNWPNVIGRSKRRGAKSFNQFCRDLIDTRSEGGLFASKLGWGQLYFLAKLKLIPDVFATPRFIHVRRRDLLGQAISFVIAKQTGAWTSEHEAKGEPVYDADAIAERVKTISLANARLDTFFATFGFPRLDIVYEDFLADKAGSVNAITEWLGLGSSTINQGDTQLQRQHSSINAEWRERFLAKQRAYFGPSFGSEPTEPGAAGSVAPTSATH